ncbi:MAG: class I SAM-dependent methyltransferase [Candidatus Levybacteria bacterium]|nr:class I SAM-dependent methyltransferase [Candidatus Levybacteria bacterium]
MKPNFKIIRNSNFTYRHLLRYINEHLGKNTVRILDIGCGSGSISLYLANKGYSVTGLDISGNAIQACKKGASKLNLKNVKFIKENFPKTNLPKKAYDMVIFTEVIEHINDDALAIRTISKILREEGILILSTPSIHAPLYKLGLTNEFDRKVGHLRRYSIEQLKKLLLINNFTLIKIKGSEGILRNLLFVNPLAGKLVRLINHSDLLSNIVTAIDDSTLRLFGESNYIIVARKASKKSNKNKKNL